MKLLNRFVKWFVYSAFAAFCVQLMAGAALAADINIQSKGGSGDLKQYPVADNVTIYKGALVVLDTSGYLRPARATNGETVVGVADEKVDNTTAGHTAGGKKCRVVSGKHFLLTFTGTATQASVGRPCYAADDQTVQAAMGPSQVGIVTEFVSATQVWVFVETPTLGQAQIFTGSGAPAFNAAKGSLYIRTDGSSTATRMYINTDGAGTWTNFTTAA